MNNRMKIVHFVRTAEPSGRGYSRACLEQAPSTALDSYGKESLT